MNVQSEVTETPTGITYRCGRCGKTKEQLGLDEVIALAELHRDQCPARPHCPNCHCGTGALMVEWLVENYPGGEPS